MVAQLDSEFLRIAPDRALSRLIGYSIFEGRPLTTRGRRLNPVVFQNLRFAARRTPHTVDRPVFIVGMGRSGTTLLGQILAAHPDVGFLNEPKAMWHVIREDEDIIGSYAAPNTGRLHLDAADANEDVIHRGRALFSWYLRLSHSKRVVDKYPELIFRHTFVRAIFPDARFLVAVRSPWSTLRSVARWSNSHAVGEADWWGARGQKWDILWEQGVTKNAGNADLAPLGLAGETNPFTRAAVEWIVTMREAIALASADPRAHVIDYDAFVAQPRILTRRTLKCCQLSASSRTESYAAAIVTPHPSSDARAECVSQLPEALVGAIDATWDRLRGADQTLA